MEEILDNINKLLICKKEEIRKKLFTKLKYCRCSEELKIQEYDFFQRSSIIINDKEFEELRKEYEKISYLICLIDELKKKIKKNIIFIKYYIYPPK